MTLREAYEYGREQLKFAGIDDADLDAWFLLEVVTGVTRTMYYVKMQDDILPEQEIQYREFIETRATHIPLQHITGVQEFMGLEFLVNEHVLVPRQDTEVLVESALEVLEPGMKVLDMCTGSGCILLSLLKCMEMKCCQQSVHQLTELQEGWEATEKCNKQVVGVGVDISEDALKVAKANGEKIGVKAELIQSDLFENVSGKYDVIVSNPPYIRTAVIEELKEEVRCHDPLIALDGKEDGLYFYRRIVGEGVKFLSDGGRLFFEIGHDQGEDVKKLMEQAGFTSVVVKKDLAGLDRVLFGQYNY